MRCQKHHEVLSLQSKVKHFEDGREYSKLSDEIIRKNHKIDSLQKEKEKLRTEIKELHRKNYEMESELKAEQNSYETLLNAYNKLNDRVTESDLIYSDQFAEQMDKLFLDLMKRIEDLEGKNKKLTAQINRDYTNSSTPSSRDPNHAKIISNSRTPSGRKPGAQPGGKPNRRKHFTPTEPTVYLVPKEVAEHPDEWEMLDNSRVRQLVDVKMVVTCTEYCAHAFRNKKTNKIIFSAFPDNVVNEMNYGESLKALCCLLL